VIDIQKRKNLSDTMAALAKNDTVVAFSGGADSSLVLKLAREAAKKDGTRVTAVMLHTALHPVGEVSVARSVARDCGADFEVIEVDELAEAGIENNPVDRCYRCKHTLFSKLVDLAREKGAGAVLDGTNADDLLVYRPGLKALDELGVKSPLKDAGLSKADVRDLAREYNVSVADRPSAPCLATRFPYGTPLNRKALDQVAAGENALRCFGFYNLRLRVYGDMVRLEVDAKDLGVVMANREAIVAVLKKNGYRTIALDLEGFRSGSFDEGLK
jgi:uncharacterized protein